MQYGEWKREENQTRPGGKEREAEQRLSWERMWLFLEIRTSSRQ